MGTGGVIRRACALGGRGREDAAAVQEVVRAAGRWRPNVRLQVAEAELRADRHHHDEGFDRAHRLLVAASGDARVPPLTPERAEFFGQVRWLEDAPLDKAWRRLVSAQPALSDLEAELLDAGEQRPDDPREALAALCRAEDGRLLALVGPGAQHAVDPLVHNYAAYRVAYRHLCHAYGLGDRDITVGGYLVRARGRPASVPPVRGGAPPE